MRDSILLSVESLREPLCGSSTLTSPLCEDSTSLTCLHLTAENYYGADYPDDDTDSENDGGSDMIGHHRHSEDEGFESDDASGSDDHGEKYSIRGYSSFSQEDRSEMLDYIRD